MDYFLNKTVYQNQADCQVIKLPERLILLAIVATYPSLQLVYHL